MVSSEDENHCRLSKRTQTLTRAMIPKRYRTPVSRFLSKTMEFIHENWKRMWIITLWLTINLVLYLWKFNQYKHKPVFQVMGYCVCIAKGAAETLKLNMALILLPVCRKSLTKLRSTALNSLIPFDDNINFHKLFTLAIAIGAFVHTIVHVSCDFTKVIACPKEQFLAILGSNFNYKQPTYMDLVESTPGVTGILMVIIMAFSYILAAHSFRRKVIKLPWPLHDLAGFNSFWYAHHLLVLDTFWYAHHLLVLAYILLVIHGYFLFLTKDWREKTVFIYLFIFFSDRDIVFAASPLSIL